MTAMDCPPDGDLRAFHLGDLDEARLDAVAAHLETCPRCEAAASALDRLDDPALGGLRGLPSESAPLVAPPPTAGQRVGSYEIVRELGRGGMGVVYLARDPRLDRPVALKMLLGGPFAAPAYRARFRAEAQTIARLHHPNIVQVHEVGTWRPEGVGEPVSFLALEFVEGGSLEERTGGKPQPPAQAAAWLETLARAVDYAHGQGVVHRDLKPSNVLFTDRGEIKLCDFSVAKVAGGSALRTATGLLVGTPEYMAPEQAAGHARDAGPAADVWALGVVLYELLAGRPPFQAPDLLGVLDRVRGHEPVPPRSLVGTVPTDLNTICLKCLEKEPGRRYATAAALADDLRRFLDGRAVTARPVGPFGRTWRWCRREPALASLVGALAAVVLVALTLVTWKWRDAEARRDAEAEARAEAEAYRQEARHNLYAANVRLARQALDGARVDYAQQLLTEAAERRPDDGDPRGFEWYYLHKLADPEVTVLQGHEDHVVAVAYAPDGATLASVGEDRTVRLWDAATGRERLVLRSARGGVAAVAFAPDGASLAGVGESGYLQIWDVADGRERRAVKVSERSLTAVAYTPEGTRLVVGGADGSVRLVDGASGQAFFTFSTPSRVTSLALDPSGHRLASAGEDGSVRLHAAADGRPLGAWRVADGAVHGVAFSPDGLALACALEDRTSRIWNVAEGRERQILRGHTGPVRGVAYSPDGARLATASSDHTLRLWSPRTGHCLAAMRGHENRVRGVAFAPDGLSVASASYDGSVRIWEAAAASEDCPLCGPSAHGVAFLPGGRLASAGEDGVVRLWDECGEATRAEGSGTSSRLLALAATPDGRWLVTGGADGVVRLWDGATGRAVRAFVGNAGPVHGVALSADGRRVAAACEYRVAIIWDLESEDTPRKLHGHTSAVRSVAFRPGGAVLATGGSDCSVRLWDVASGAETACLRGHDDYVNAVVFRDDGAVLASAGHDSLIVLWDVATGEPRARLKGHTEAVWCVAFAGEGQRLISSGRDGTVRVWETTSGKELLTLPGRGGDVWAVAVRPDGRSLAAADARGVRLFEADRVPRGVLRERERRARAAESVATPAAP